MTGAAAARTMTRRAMLLTSLAAVAGCATPAPEPAPTTITFSHLRPLRLDVARVRVVVDYVLPFEKPHVEHLASLSPAEAVRQWAKDVLKPVGTRREAVLVVTDASLVEEVAAGQSGLQGLLRGGTSERYRARLVARIEIRDGEEVLARSETTVSHSRSLSDARSLTGRARLWYEQIGHVIERFDMQQRTHASRHLGRYLVR